MHREYDPNGFDITGIVYLTERDEIKYRAMGWFDIANCCREYANQMRLGYWCASLTRMQGLA